MVSQRSEAGHSPQPLVIAGVGLALGLAFDRCFFNQPLGISFALYVWLIIVAAAGLTGYFKKPFHPHLAVLLMLLAFLSGMVSLRTSGMMTFLNVVGSLAVLLLVAHIAFEKRLTDLGFEDYLKLPFLPLMFVLPFLSTLRAVVTWRGAQGNRATATQVVKGIAMTLPVMVLLLLLLASADPVFKKMVWDVTLPPELVPRSILVLIVSSVLTGACAYLFRPSGNAEAPGGNDQRMVIGRIEYAILLGSVNVIFGAFIWIQLTYLFGGEGHVAAQGLTYAEYARKGFFELIAVGAISLLVLLTVEKYAAREAKGHARGFRLLSLALIGQVLVIMVSAIKRLELYEEAFGLTEARLLSHAFIFLLAAVFFLLVLKILTNGREQTFLFRAFAAVCLFMAGMNFMNPDVLIAKRNLKRFEATGKLDVQYLSRLSSDAWPVTLALLDHPNEEMKKAFAWHLYRHHAKYLLTRPTGGSWQSWNLSRRIGEKLLREKSAAFESVKDLQKPYPEYD